MINKRIYKFCFYISLTFIVLLAINQLMKEKPNTKINSGTDDLSSYEYLSNIEDGGVSIVENESYVFEREYILKSFSINNKEKLEKELLVKKEEAKTVDEEEEFYYTVKKGDTISQISRRLNKDMNIVIANNPEVKNGIIKIGQKLKISGTYKIFHTVKSGDALIKIARKYQVTLEDLLKDNNLKDTKIKVGQKLLIKNPKANYLGNSNKYASSEISDSFRYPVKKRGITSKYGRRKHPVLKRYIFHAGVDLRASTGTPVYATRDGKIIYSGWMSGYGKLVKIKHSNSYESRYAHLSKIYVKNGQEVKKGQLIGKAGKTGRVTGPHLHFEIRKNGKPQNPIRYIK